MTNQKLITQKEFLDKYGHSEADFQKTKLTWNILEEIYEDYCQEIQNMEKIANLYIGTIMGIDMINSVRYRVKNPEHLIEKIIRKKKEKPDLEITKENYLTEITDAIGFRGLHLFKQDILAIHPLILKIFNGCLHEIPKFYHSIRDSKKFLQEIQKLTCSLEEKGDGYRSMHYLIKIPYLNRHYIAEIQIRTIFEEGWSEINHLHNYPCRAVEPILGESLCMLNNLAGSADEMASFIRGLDRELKSKKVKSEETIKDLAEKLSKSNLEKNQCEGMLTQLESLREPTINTWYQSNALDTCGYNSTPNWLWGDGNYSSDKQHGDVCCINPNCPKCHDRACCGVNNCEVCKHVEGFCDSPDCTLCN